MHNTSDQMANWRSHSRPRFAGCLTVLFGLYVLPMEALGQEGPNTNDTSSLFSNWSELVARARMSQPNWSSPLATTTGLLENRLRVDVQSLHSGNGTSTTVLDGGKGLDLIIGDSSEIQFAAAPYDMRNDPSSNSTLSGFGDWPFLRLKQRLASSSEASNEYVVTAWFQIQAPTGAKGLTNKAWIYTPTLAFGKGWSNFDIQGTFAVTIPSSNKEENPGHQIQTNIAFQYHVVPVFWPEIEVNWTYYHDGPRDGLNLVFLTVGLVLGRFALAQDLHFTLGGGYQFAVAPKYRASPLTPTYDHAWLFTTRFNFE